VKILLKHQNQQYKLVNVHQIIWSECCSLVDLQFFESFQFPLLFHFYDNKISLLILNHVVVRYSEYVLFVIIRGLLFLPNFRSLITLCDWIENYRDRCWTNSIRYNYYDTWYGAFLWWRITSYRKCMLQRFIIGFFIKFLS